MKNIGKISVMLLLGSIIMLASVSCSGGISQDEYDSVLAELADAQDDIAALTSELAAARAVETESVESSLKYQNLLKDYNDLVDESQLAEAEYDTLNEDYEGLRAEHELLQAQNESNLNQINLLQTENTQLKAHVDNLTPPFPEIAPTAVEEGI